MQQNVFYDRQLHENFQTDREEIGKLIFLFDIKSLENWATASLERPFDLETEVWPNFGKKNSGEHWLSPERESNAASQLHL